MNLSLKITSIVAFLIISSSISMAGLPGGGGPGGDDCPEGPGRCDPTGVPFDGGVSLVLAAGAGIGAYKLRKKNKAQ